MLRATQALLLGRERHRRGHDEYGWTVGVVLRPEARAEGPKNAICDGQAAQIPNIKVDTFIR